MMSRIPIDPEEMEKRRDEDVIASLNMIGEGTPNLDSITIEEEIVEFDLPETYQ